MKEDDPEQIPLQFTATDSPKTESAETPQASVLPSLEWTCHPAKKNKSTTILVTFFLILLVVLVYYTTYSPWFAILAFIILYGSLSPFYFPTRYKLSADDIQVKTTFQTLHKKWSQYRSYYPDKNGVLLSPFLRPTRLENFRGLYIRFWNNKDEVVAYVKAQIDKTKETNSGGN